MISARDLPLLPVYVAVATAGSFTAAARELRLSKSVVSQHVRTLETRCGVRLIERSTRRLHLTQIGEQVLEAARGVLSSVRALEQVVEGQRALPTGTLRVTMPVDSGLSSMVAPLAAEMMQRYPGLGVELVLDDAARDLTAEGLDVALRLGTLAASSHVVRRLGSEPEVVVASPSRFEEHGAPEHPRALAGAPWLAHSALPIRAAWTLRSDAGEPCKIAVRMVATANTVLTVRDLLRAGAGFGVVPRHVVHDDLRDGRLVHVCPRWFHRRVGLFALLPSRQVPPRVRVFLDALVEAAAPSGFDRPGGRDAVTRR